MKGLCLAIYKGSLFCRLRKKYYTVHQATVANKIISDSLYGIWLNVWNVQSRTLRWKDIKCGTKSI